MTNFTRACGLSLAVGGGLLILINTILTPMLPVGEGEAVLRTSLVYLVRLSASAVTALFLLIGCIGLHLSQRGAGGLFGTVAFALAFLGNVLLFALEWANVFVLRPVAQVYPEALPALDQSPLLNLGFASGASLFALGWLLMAMSVIRSGPDPRWWAGVVLAGLVLVPVLTVSPLGTAGAIAGSAVLGVGFIGLGLAVVRAAFGPYPDG